MSKRRFPISAWPTGSWPQTCLAPQYQPSQLSGCLACMVNPPKILKRRYMQPWAACTTFVSPWPSHWSKTDSSPYCSLIRLISLAMMVAASSQLIRTYLLLPRFCGFLSPLGSQSTLFIGYRIRLGEVTRFLYPKAKGGIRDLLQALNSLPRALMVQGRNSFRSYFLSYLAGRVRRIFPSLTSISARL